MVIYYKMTIKISLNTNIIQTLQSNVTNNNNVFDLQQADGFVRSLQVPPSIKLTTTI